MASAHMSTAPPSIRHGKTCMCCMQRPQDVEQSLAQVAHELDLDQPAAQRLVCDHPRFLDLEGVRAVLQDLRHFMPKLDPRQACLQA